MAEHYERVYSFEHLLRKLLANEGIWDITFIGTDINSYAVIPFYADDDIIDETEIYFDLKTNVHYINSKGDVCIDSFIFTTTEFDNVLDMEGKVRKIIPMIYE